VPVSTRTDVVDTSKGTVHMVLGGGGTSVPSNPLFFNPPQCRVITAVGDPGPVTGKRAPVYVTENAPWSAVRDAAHSYGFGDLAQCHLLRVLGPDGRLQPFETFTLQRQLSDAGHH
jgi:hypothetical protein